jgi:hypothetical protein
MASWAEVVLPVQTADARSSPATSRRRATLRAPEMRGSCPTTGPREGPVATHRSTRVDDAARLFSSSVDCEPVSRSGYENRFSIVSTRIRLHPFCGFHFGEDVPSTWFGETGIRVVAFDAVDSTYFGVAFSVKRGFSIVFSVCLLLRFFAEWRGGL